MYIVLMAKDSAGNDAFRASLPLNKMPDKRTFTLCMLTVAERLNVGLKDNSLLILLINWIKAIFYTEGHS
jgi:hypothetical protein